MKRAIGRQDQRRAGGQGHSHLLRGLTNWRYRLASGLLGRHAQRPAFSLNPWPLCFAGLRNHSARANPLRTCPACLKTGRDPNITSRGGGQSKRASPLPFCWPAHNCWLVDIEFYFPELGLRTSSNWLMRTTPFGRTARMSRRPPIASMILRSVLIHMSERRSTLEIAA